MTQTQRSLFDLSGEPSPPVANRWLNQEPKAVARATDHEPSKTAGDAYVTSGAAASDCQRICEVIAESRLNPKGPRGSLTAKEIATFAGWMLGTKAHNERVSRRTKELERDSLIVVTGVRPTFNKSDEPAITSYALAAECCGKPANWLRASLGNGKETRTCKVCEAALGIGGIYE